VNNYSLLGFNVGPTLAAWLARHAPATYERMVVADGDAGTAIAQAYHHSILPLATRRDVRTEIRWGLADFEHRFGRRAEGIWLPESAVKLDMDSAPTGGEAMRCAIGQARIDDVTPLQVAVALGAVGHGRLRPPQLVRSIEGYGDVPARSPVEPVTRSR
jgi:cell division protein FtsI/penicillin-binding protein 2